jgi:ribosome maturation factor RimP
MKGYFPGMQFSARKNDGALLFDSLASLLRDVEMALVEFDIFHGKRRGGKASVNIRAVVLKTGITGIEDCAKAHRIIMPRLDLAFPESDIYLEVSSPGINRLIKDGAEFAHYLGRSVSCYRTDISDWSSGILRAVDEEKIVIEGEGGETILPFDKIAKARLNSA